MQVSCGFRCTCFFLEGRQIYWCGTAGDIKKQATPVEFDYYTKVPELFSVGNHEIIKLNHTWSRTMSVMYATVAETAPLKLKLKNNIKMNFLLSSLTTKWTTKDLYPPKIEHMEQFIADKHILKTPASAQAAAEKQTPKRGIANRNNYISNGGRWMAMIHFPASAEVPDLDIASYKDITRVYNKVYNKYIIKLTKYIKKYIISI